ncbi:fatty-acid and retinol-binding protein 1, variant [Loa loa]|uniref:Fatty-acid and retinol-binding protein 1 n=2 Tax=Loa loa TaxID=7209 RepID=FAR1_LOALO|nr:fatty-acid and retinol-binding protein 1 [Loa loa]XP_020305963.1 fatty-acid and retinol-binding protein 1, variant [Loa loa]Q962W7.2 RecName: Full=Fatty-acid and retinol-binding protein 1; AltName: Full=Ll-FAR-1; AltName: Full=Ll20; Flags: Precursor [Loa loa]EFO23085.2 fatty-acid and retinol-binding protein 1 [Loa loa]EJD75079.1 fatty-acid and retinol-binding protein 1, variant [Loa loa]
MYHQLILLALIGTIMANVIPFSLSNISEEYKEFIPEEVRNFYKGLTAEDKEILRDLASKHATFANEDAALEALKDKSDKLYKNAVELRNFVKAKIDSLKPDAKAFVDEVIARARSLRSDDGQKFDTDKIKQAARDIIAKYQALNEETKEELKVTFPPIAKIISNEKLKRVASTFLQKN